MGTRAELAQALRDELTIPGLLVIDAPRQIDSIPAKVRAVIMLMRKTIGPAANAEGSYIETFDLTLIEPLLNDKGPAEDHLDEAADELLIALGKLSWLTLTEPAERSTYNETYPAYRFPLTLITTKKE